MQQTNSIRHRRPPVDRVALYGEFAPYMFRGEKLHDDISDRAAYVFITGYFPSHLRPKSTQILRQITRPYRRPSSLDSRKGERILHDDAIRDLDLNNHAMVKAVREKIRQGFLIEPSRGFGKRRGYSKIFMFKRLQDRKVFEKITVTLEGAVKGGWE